MPGSGEATPEQQQETVDTTSTMDQTELLQALLGKLVMKREKPKVPTFSGRHAKSKDTSFSDWSYIVEKAIDEQEYFGMSDRGMQNVVFESLVGEARTRFIREDRAGKSLRQILDAFKVAYGDVTPSIDRLQALHLMRQNKDETVVQYADRLENAAYLIEQSSERVLFDKDATLRAVFVKGLFDSRIPDLMMHLRDNPDKTYDDIRAKAILLENEQTTVVRTEKKAVKAVLSDDILKRILDRLEKLEKTDADGPTKKPFNGQSRPPVTCYQCGAKGHFKRNCPANVEGDKKQTDKTSLNLE